MYLFFFIQISEIRNRCIGQNGDLKREKLSVNRPQSVNTNQSVNSGENINEMDNM